ALGSRALVGVDGGHHQGRRVQSVVVLRVGRGAGDHLGNRFTRGLRGPAQDVQRVGHRAAANQVDDPARLSRRHPDKPRLGDRRGKFRSGAHRRLAFRSSLMCPLKVRVGANSPSLWPTIASVTNTGTCLRSSWTAKVCAIKSGIIVDRRDQVLMTCLLFFLFCTSTFLSRWSSTKGPFFRLRGIVGYSWTS